MPDEKRIELRKAVVELRERGLYESARWAAELMAGKGCRLSSLSKTGFQI